MTAGLERLLRSGQEMDAIKLQLPQRVGGNGKMSMMDWVERPAQDTKLHTQKDAPRSHSERGAYNYLAAAAGAIHLDAHTFLE